MIFHNRLRELMHNCKEPLDLSSVTTMTPLLFVLTLLALTSGENCLTKLEVLDMMEDLEARYDAMLKTVKAELEANYNEKLKMETEKIRKDIASEVAQLEEDDVLLCVYKYHWTDADSTITFDRYLDTNYDNGDRADMNLDTGIFTCLTSGFYTITFADISRLLPSQQTWIWLYMNGERVDGSHVEQDTGDDTIGDFLSLSGSRTLVNLNKHTYTIALVNKHIKILKNKHTYITK